MALNTTLRRSASTVIPLVALFGRQRNFNHHASEVAGEEAQKFKSSFGGRKSHGSNENLQKADFRKRSPMAYNSSTYRNLNSHGSTHQWRGLRKTRKRASLMTHYLEVNYRTLKAVVFYGPSIESSPVRPLVGKNIH